MKRVLLLAALLALAGCSNPERLYPLKVGNSWTYKVQNGLAEFVQKVKVERRTPVAGVQGYELDGTMGVSRIAWKDGVLLASVLPSLRANPPLPLVSAKGADGRNSWKGRIFTGGKVVSARAIQTQSPGTYMKGSRKLQCIKSVLTLYLPDREMETTTFYANGLGPVSQVQRTKQGSTDRFDLGIEHLGGP